MGIMATKTLLTVAQFMQLPDDEDRPVRRELEQGELVELPSPTFLHNFICQEIVASIRTFAKGTRLGTVLTGTSVQLDSNTVYIPDAVFWDAQHVASIDKEEWLMRIVPQLTVEVASPSNSLSRMLRKARDYRRAGVHTVWVVNADPFEIHVFDPGPRRVITAGQKLEAPDVLPGFSVDPALFLPNS
jgi:Uma2 family endonuclease